MTGIDQDSEMIQIWRKIFQNELKAKWLPWVLFKHGTIVMVEDAESEESTKEKAKTIMETQGPVIPGTPHGDFNMFDADSVKGVVVTGHCPFMFNFVSTADGGEPNAMVLGLTGRSKRDEDSQTCEIIHIEMQQK